MNRFSIDLFLEIRNHPFFSKDMFRSSQLNSYKFGLVNKINYKILVVFK
jgi:hypothetical protein